MDILETTSTKPKAISVFAGGDSNEIRSLPNDLAVNEILIQQSFKKVLKEKFNNLLQAGRMFIEKELGSNLILPTPLEESESNNLTEELETLTTLNERKTFVQNVANVSTVDHASPAITNDQYMECIKMLNALVYQLNDAHRKHEGFLFNDVPTRSYKEGSEFDLITALQMHRQVKGKLLDKQRVKEDKKAEYFSLSYQLGKFLSEKKQEIAAKSFNKYEYAFLLLGEVFPDGCDLRSFSKVETQQVKDMLSTRQTNQSKGCTGKLLSVKTKNGILSNYRTFFSWLIDNTEIDITNPFSKSSFAKAKGKNKAPKRRSFELNEIQKILDYTPEHGGEAKDFKNDAKWYLPIALYSGMRLNEMSVLPLSHVKKIDEVWCFDLNGLDVKNEASERIIPIAQYLLDLGILDYVASLKKRGETLLFPEIRRGKEKPGSSGWGDPIGRWFNRTVLKKIDIDVVYEKTLGKLISFHSLRRTLISTCVNGAAEQYLIKRLVGHSLEDDITLTVYADVENIPLKTLKELLDKHLVWHVK